MVGLSSSQSRIRTRDAAAKRTYDAGMTRREGTGPGRVLLTGGPLRVAEVVAVARGRVPVELGEEGRKRMAGARDVVERAVAGGRRVYGVSTGFGLLANTAVDPGDLEELQRRIVLSHATGTGDPLDVEVVRAMQLLRARTLTQGHSGVRPVVVEALLALLAAGVTPVIPEHGSAGAAAALLQGGPVAGQRHRGDARAGLPGGGRRRGAGGHGRPGVRHVDRGAARHRPPL